MGGGKGEYGGIRVGGFVQTGLLMGKGSIEAPVRGVSQDARGGEGAKVVGQQMPIVLCRIAANDCLHIAVLSRDAVVLERIRVGGQKVALNGWWYGMRSVLRWRLCVRTRLREGLGAARKGRFVA